MAAVGLRAGGIESGGFSVEKEALSSGDGDGGDGDDSAGLDGGGGGALGEGIMGDADGASQDVLSEDDVAFSRKVRNCIRYISRHQFPQARPSCLVPVVPKAVYTTSQKTCSCGGIFVHDGEVDATLITAVSAPSCCVVIVGIPVLFFLLRDGANKSVLI